MPAPLPTLSLICMLGMLCSPGLAQPHGDAGPWTGGLELERTRCRVKDVSLSVLVETHGDEPASDPTSVWVEHGSKRVRVALPEDARFVLEGGDLTLMGPPRACDGTVALAHPKGRLLVLLAMDARPHGNELAGFVYDVHQRAVTATFAGLFPYGRVLRAEAWKDALLVTSQRTLDPPFGQCPAHCPAVLGSKTLRLTGDELDVTWRLSLSGGFTRVVNTQKTRVDSGLGRLLRTEAQFAQAAGIPADGSKIERTFKATAELEDGRRCFALLATQRMPTDEEWSCRR